MDKLVREEFFGVARDMVDILLEPFTAHDLHSIDTDSQVLHNAVTLQHRVDVLEM